LTITFSPDAHGNGDGVLSCFSLDFLHKLPQSLLSYARPFGVIIMPFDVM